MNLKVRIKNPVFWAQILLSVLVPILTYFGLETSDLTSWSVLFSTLFDAVKNPYVLGLIVVSVWNALNDPTTKGLTDSEQAMSYSQPK